MKIKKQRHQHNIWNIIDILPTPINIHFKKLQGMDKITASWVCLSLISGGIQVAQPCEVLKK